MRAKNKLLGPGTLPAQSELVSGRTFIADDGAWTDLQVMLGRDQVLPPAMVGVLSNPSVLEQPFPNSASEPDLSTTDSTRLGPVSQPDAHGVAVERSRP